MSFVLNLHTMATIVRNKELKSLNTFGITATAAGYAEFRTPEELKNLLSDPEWAGKPWYVLGGGSNILFRGNYDGLILHPAADGITVTDSSPESVTVRAEAGTDWDTFVRYCVERGYGGVENLSGIPGCVGASPIQNIGAYGVEVKDTIASVEAYLTRTGETVTLTNAECRFGYRDSIFKRELKGSAVVLAVSFRLATAPAYKLGYGDLCREVESLGGPTLHNVRQAVTHIRNSKLPDPKVLGNSGSFFKNPVVENTVAEKLKATYPDIPTYPAGDKTKLAAGWLIDRVGMKGHREGDAGVHDRQALVLVNYGTATGSDILALAGKVIGAVQEKFGITIEMEVNTL